MFEIFIAPSNQHIVSNMIHSASTDRKITILNGTFEKNQERIKPKPFDRKASLK